MTLLTRNSIFKAAILLVSICISVGISDSQASDNCNTHKISTDEISTISKIAQSCEFDVRDKKRTTGFGNYICLGERIHTKTADRYLKRVKDAKYVFVHNNYGGVSISGSEIGDDIFDHKRTLIISGFCVSACANYLFTAADRVIFIGPPSRSFPAWHGSSPADKSILPDVSPERQQAALDAHQVFLQRFTPTHRDQVSRLMGVSRDGLSGHEERRLGKIWTYADDELCQKFDFHNLTRLSDEEVSISK